MKSTNEMRKVYCPLVKRMIDEVLCDEVSYVAEGQHPKRFLPEEFKIADYEAICYNCENHPE